MYIVLGMDGHTVRHIKINVGNRAMLIIWAVETEQQ
jgi:hypothetical protein